MDTILFDWDGTLLDSAPYAFLAFQKAFGELGIALEPETSMSGSIRPTGMGCIGRSDCRSTGGRRRMISGSRHYGQTDGAPRRG